MKKFLELLFGKVGLLISAVIMAIASWFLFPLFVDFVTGANSLSKILGWFICPFAIGFLLSSVFSSLSLLFKGIRDRKWLWVVLGLIVFAFDVVVVVMAFIYKLR